MRFLLVSFLVCAGVSLWLTPISAAQASSTVQATTSTVLVLHVDEGFLGRPAAFNLFDDEVRLTWSSGDIVEPLDITLEHLSATSVKVIFSDPQALGARGVTISLKPSENLIPTKWDKLVLEVATATGIWQVVPHQAQADGYVSARLEQSSELRLYLQPQGMRQGQASWYRYKRCRCAASPDFSKGTQLYVKRIDRPDKATVVVVNDFGPERDIFPERVIDLDALAFAELAPLGAGIIEVAVEPLLKTDPRLHLLTRPTDKSMKIAYSMSRSRTRKARRPVKLSTRKLSSTVKSNK